MTGCTDPPLVTVITDGLGDGDAEVVGGVVVVELLDGDVDECEVVVEEEVGGIDIDVDVGLVKGPLVVVTVVDSLLAGDGVEVEGGASVDVGRSGVVLVELDIVKMRSYWG